MSTMFDGHVLRNSVVVVVLMSSSDVSASFVSQSRGCDAFCVLVYVASVLSITL
jgi:hypothetical protein